MHTISQHVYTLHANRYNKTGTILHPKGRILLDFEISEKFRSFYEEQLKDVRLPGRIVSRYRVAACLASAEQKEIYLIESKETGQKFILRQLPLSRAQANEAEFALLSGARHSRIPQAVELFTEDGFSYLIRTYIDGASLYQLVKARGPQTEREVCGILLQLCDILSYLHGLHPPVIHRDIKPQNIVINPQGEVFLIDFDISRTFDPEATQDTVFFGTSTSAPPEQYGYAQTDVRSDIYALGILIIFLYTGKFERSSIRELPPKLSRVAETCTQFAPKDRYASAQLLKKDLLSLRRRGGLRVAAAAVAVCCIAAAFYLGSLSAQRASAAHPTATPAAAFASPTPIATPDSVRLPAVAQDGTVSFASPQMEQLIRFTLGKKESEPVYVNELAAINSLSIVGNLPGAQGYVRFERDTAYYNDNPIVRGDLETLADLSLLKNLTSLELIYERIEDLSPLRSLHLKSLHLEGNFISDLSPLSEIKTLRELRVDQNPINSLSALSSLARLEKLSLQCCGVTDISPLSRLQSLKDVDLFQVPCLDYSPLVSISVLRSVNISDSGPGDVAVVVANKNIRELIVHRCGITDLDAFNSLPDLERLELWQDEITDLNGIERFENLTSLCLSYTKVSDLRPLIKLKRLQELSVDGLNIDLTPLLSIPSLKTVNYTADMQAMVDKIKSKASFQFQLR